MKTTKPTNPFQHIDIDYALSTDLTPAELAHVFSSAFQWYAEPYQVRGIKRHLRTPEQKAVMDAHDFTIEDMLNGRIEGEAAQAAADTIFDEWNAKIGHRAFGY